MSLQVWLPLNGNLNNQGLSEVTVTNNGATVDNNGKIGSCYSFNGSNNRVSISDPLPFTGDLTMMAWLKPTNVSSTTTQYALSYNTDMGGTSGHLLGVGMYGSSALAVWCSGTVFTTSVTLVDNTWYHVAASRAHTGELKVYVNGSCILTTADSNAPASRWFTIGGRSNSATGGAGGVGYCFKGNINDVRLYDHCLSAKEVKEISKGLLCHYKLSSNGFGNPNLLSNSHFDSRYTVSVWDTSKNGNLCANGWDGYNGGVGNPSTVYHAHLQEHEGEYVYNYHKTSNEEWLGISQYITGSVEVSKTYTFSCELKRISGKNYTDGGLYTRANSSATSNTFVNLFSFSNFGSVTDNKWHRYSYTFTVDSSVYMTNGAYWYIYGHTGGDGEFLMRRPKLEEGSSATEWIPRSSDSLYASLGLDSTTESDCSGLSNNGTKIEGLSSSTNPLSIRYESCYDFDGNTGSIQIPNLSTLAPSGEFTMNCWIYHDNTWSSKGYETIFGGPSGFELEAKLSSTNSPSLFAYSWGQGQATYELNKWNMITMTRNTSETKFYINGELKITGSAGTIPSGNYFIGAWNTSSQQNYKGRISDFRLYSTVLSADVIRMLYDTSASIDKNGSMYAYEFKEE